MVHAVYCFINCNHYQFTLSISMLQSICKHTTISNRELSVIKRKRSRFQSLSRRNACISAAAALQQLIRSCDDWLVEVIWKVMADSVIDSRPALPGGNVSRKRQRSRLRCIRERLSRKQKRQGLQSLRHQVTQQFNELSLIRSSYEQARKKLIRKQHSNQSRQVAIYV